MSIYCSIFDIGDEHKPKCARMKKVGRKSYSYDDSRDCTCGACPIKYEGSHVLPSTKSPRDGSFGFAAIPGHITRSGRDNGTKRYWPYLRFHMNDHTQVFTRKQAEKLRDALTEWLEAQNG